jgi:excinuclease ABC subunit C
LIPIQRSASPFHLSIEIPNVKLIVPKVGDKKRIVELSEKMRKNTV